MSFAVDVKKELASLTGLSIIDSKAELYGILRSKAEIVLRDKVRIIQVDLNSSFLARHLFSLVKKCYQTEVNLYQSSKKAFNKIPAFRLEIMDALDILKDLDLVDEYFLFKEEVTKKFNKNLRSVLRGIFLMRGSLNNPENKNYHLEFVSRDKELTKFLLKTLKKERFTPNVIERRNRELVYLKKSENIGDFLNLIGARKTLYTFEDLRIIRDSSNVSNRIVNCDIANSLRSHEACQKQLKAIKEFLNIHDISNLREEMQHAIKLRLSYPDDTLKELEVKSFEEFGHTIFKSRLSELYKEIIKENNSNK